jgi:hypothetical protein
MKQGGTNFAGKIAGTRCRGISRQTCDDKRVRLKGERRKQETLRKQATTNESATNQDEQRGEEGRRGMGGGVMGVEEEGDGERSCRDGWVYVRLMRCTQKKEKETENCQLSQFHPADHVKT